MEKIFKNPTIKIVAIALFASVLTGSIIFYTFMKKDSVAVSSESRVQDITEKSLAKLAENTSQKTPLKIDDNTTLTSVLATENKITYFYALNHDKSEMDMEFFNQNMRRLTTTNICKDFSSRNLLDKGALMSYSFSDKNDQFLSIFTVRKSVCKSL